MANLTTAHLTTNETNFIMQTSAKQDSTEVTIFNTNSGFHLAFNLYLTAIVLMVGLVANVLICVVMSKPTFKKLPLSVYFTALAVSDTVVLCIIATRQIVYQLTGILHLGTTYGCTLLHYLLNVAAMMSSWIIVSIAVERLLVVKFPLKVKDLTR